MLPDLLALPFFSYCVPVSLQRELAGLAEDQALIDAKGVLTPQVTAAGAAAAAAIVTAGQPHAPGRYNWSNDELLEGLFDVADSEVKGE